MNHQYTIYTLVDITPTGVFTNNNKNPELEHKRNQQRNFDTLCQVVSLRANIHNPTVQFYSINAVKSLFPNLNLPDEYLCWEFEFFTDRLEVFGPDHRALLNDLHMVPVVPALDETVPVFPPYFICYGDLKNVYIP